MMKKLVYISVFMCVAMAFSCGHTHEHSETMKEVIEMNVKLWEDLNATKANLKTQISSLESDVNTNVGAEINLKSKNKLDGLNILKAELAQLDALIPELEGYEPKCNHEPGEPDTHNSVDLAGVPENELLEIHKELKAKLDKVKVELSKAKSILN